MSVNIPLNELMWRSYGAWQSGVGGAMVRVDVELTRAANATLYTAKTVVAGSGIVTSNVIANAARAVGGSGYITGIMIQCDLSTIADTFRVHLYNSQRSLPADGAAFTRVYTSAPSRSPHVDVGPLSTEGSGSDAAGSSNIDIRVPFICTAASKDLQFALEALNGHTPKSGGKILVSFFIDQN